MTIPENYFTLVEYRRGSKDLTYDAESAPSIRPDSNFIFFSPMSFAVFFNEGNLGSQFNILELNLSPGMAGSVIPSLVLWGRHDAETPRRWARTRTISSVQIQRTRAWFTLRNLHTSPLSKNQTSSSRKSFNLSNAISSVRFYVGLAHAAPGMFSNRDNKQSCGSRSETARI